MSVVAALFSILLFLAFVSAGVQKVVFNPMMSKAAEHLGFTKRGYQRIGVVEILGATAVVVGVVASGASALGVINEMGAAGLTVMMAMAVVFHVRNGDGAKYFTPALALGLLALLEVIFRLA
jgi:uncharacterized membrane protein YphA (DoxX/SURF4 family)